MPSIDDYHWTEANLLEFEVHSDEILLLARVPKHSDLNNPISIQLKFSGVSRSSRTVSEYIGNPKSNEGFREPHTIRDILSASEEARTIYHIEGISQAIPPAWIDWEIEAKKVWISEKAT